MPTNRETPEIDVVRDLVEVRPILRWECWLAQTAAVVYFE